MEINLTENSYIFQSAKRILNKELDKCYNLLKKNEEAWNEFMDLKLHDISYGVDISFKHNDATISFDDSAYSFYFDEFCKDNYEMFVEDCLQMYNVDFERLRDNVGRTSSFYLGKLHNNDSAKYLCALVESSNSLANLQCSVNIGQEDNGFYIVEEEDYDDIEQYMNDMLELAEVIYDELNDKMTNIINVYNHIHEFKENQVEYFKEWVKDSWLNNL